MSLKAEFEISCSRGQNHVMWGHHGLDLWPQKSNVVIFEFKWRFAPNLKKFPQGVLKILRSQVHSIVHLYRVWISDLWPPNSNQFIHEPKTFVPNLKGFPGWKCFWDIAFTRQKNVISEVTVTLNFWPPKWNQFVRTSKWPSEPNTLKMSWRYSVHKTKMCFVMSQGPWPLTFDPQILHLFICESNWCVGPNFEVIPSRRSWYIVFTTMGRPGKPGDMVAVAEAEAVTVCPGRLCTNNLMSVHFPCTPCVWITALFSQMQPG